MFDDRGPFVAVMKEYVACKPLVNQLRGNVQVERQLAKFEEEAKTFPPRHSQLAAIRYYLHHMLWNCQNNWGNYHKGITNYVTFLDSIDRWRYESSEQVCYVTFNYDTMIERSMKDLWNCTFESFDAYISDPRFKLIKLHGSIDWALQFKDFPARKTPAEVIRDAEVIGVKVTEQYRKVVRTPAVFDDGHFGFPALAIPVEKKSEFLCPPEHLKALADVLPSVTKMITIGWRATEQHFLTMLKKKLTGLQSDVDLMAVSGSDDGVRGTVNSLAIGPPNTERKRELIANGFSGLIKQIGLLETFLR
ncbi:MAG TPA: hypothetical protein VE377_12895 [Candidatus Dormibacteraeota bacterium]|nr:hypothetical protein [Candidatus Dormibacteraeota bacterium]